MANFTPQMLRDLLESPDPKDQEFARQLSDLEYANEDARLANYSAPNPYANEDAKLASYGPAAPISAPVPTVPTERDRLNEELNKRYMQGDIGGKWQAQDEPFPAPTAVAGTSAGPQELQPNSFRNERTGKVTTLSPPQEQAAAADAPPTMRREGYAANEKILDQMQQRDGKIIQLVEAPSIDGFGRQTMARWTRVVTPDALDPYKQAEAKAAKLAAETRALSPQGILEASKAKKAGEDAANVERRARLTPTQRAAEDFKAQGGRLSPDQEVDPETGAVRARTGSKLYNKQKADYANDVSAVKTLQATADDVSKKVKEILADESGFSSNFGGYNAEYATKYLPGAQDVRNKLNSIYAAMKTAGKNMMTTGGTSIGQITEKEWPILQDQIAALSSMNSEEEAKRVLQSVVDRIQSFSDIAQQKHESTFNESQFYKGAKTAPGAPNMGAAVPVKTPEEARRLPKGTLFVTPDGQQRRVN